MRRAAPILVALVLAACSGDGGKHTAPSRPPVSSTTTVTAPAPPTPERLGRFRIEAPGTLETVTTNPVTSLSLGQPGITYSVRFNQAPDGVTILPSAAQLDGLRDELLRQI